MKILSPWPLIALLATTAVAPGARHALPASPPAALLPLAHSALLTLEGAVVADGLILRVRSNAGATPVTVSDLSVALEGNAVAVAPGADGSWRVALPPRMGASEGTLDVTVTHDGIRELLHATIPWPKAAPPAPTPLATAAAVAPDTSAAPAPGAGSTGVHRQIVWWILNIGIVLIAALALSRRRS